MTREELIAALERERVRDPDALAQERYIRGAVERVAGLHPAYTPVSERQAKKNRALLAALADEIAAEERREKKGI